MKFLNFPLFYCVFIVYTLTYTKLNMDRILLCKGNASQVLYLDMQKSGLDIAAPVKIFLMHKMT